MTKCVFKSNFNNDSWYIPEDDGLHTVYLGNYKPDEILKSVTGRDYFMIDESKLLPRKNKNGKIYYKVLIK